jgi:hypothetical protein
MAPAISDTAGVLGSADRSSRLSTAGRSADAVVVSLAAPVPEHLLEIADL